jgi:8-oxo-dGTP diphosphatase
MAEQAPSKTIGIKSVQINYEDRFAVRIITKNNQNEIVIIHVAKGNYYKIPGGGIEGDEDHGPAAEREALEETGCNVKVRGDCFGTVEEFRNDLHQISYCYVADLIEDTGLPELTELEKSEGLKHEWVPVEAVLEKMRSVQPTSELGKSIQERDIFFIEEFLKL